MTPCDEAREVLDFWFGALGDADYGEFREAWFRKDEDFDREVTQKFGGLHDKAASGGLDGWKDDAEECLALIIVLDQFPRNIYRGDPRSFATDKKALDVAKHAVERGIDGELPPFQRSFVYMPYMHSEDIGDQTRCVELFELMGEAGEKNLGFAVSHRDIIARFGRFPHRNEVLGRQSTPEETEFLTQPGSSF